MSKIPIIQSLVFKDSKAIVMPAWFEGEPGWGDLSHPDPYVLDTVQKYPIGTKFIDGDRVFHYGYIHSVGSNNYRTMGGMKNFAEEMAVTFDNVAHEIGETEIVIEDTDSAVNLWAGGYLMPRVSSAALGYGKYSSYRVLSSTATDQTHVTLTLDRGLIVEVPANEDGFLNQNMYSKLRCMLPPTSDEWTTSVGVNLVRAVASRWVWLQTWGPCYVTGGDELLGASADVRRATFHRDGTVYSDATANQKQLAGYAIPKSSSSTSTWHIFLMLAC